MRELVLDASVVAKWYHRENETNVEAAEELRTEFGSGGLSVAVPPLMHIELMNLAARRWRFTELDLLELGRSLLELPFIVQQPHLVSVGRWAGRGLTAYDACYVALAEERRTTVVTADRQMVSVAAPLAVALASPAMGEG